MDVRYALFCDLASRTDSGKVILHGIFDKLQVKAVPTSETPIIHPSMSFAYDVRDVAFVQGAIAKFELVHEETNAIVVNLSLPISKFNPSSPTLGGVISLLMTPLVSVGKYLGRLSLNGEVIAVGEFAVEKQD